MKARLLMLVSVIVLMVGVGSAITQKPVVQAQDDVHDRLVAREQEKWDSFLLGEYDAVTPYYAEDFINVGLTPMGAVRQFRDEALAMSDPTGLSPADIVLSDFLFVDAENTVVVTYIVSAPFGDAYMTSVWALRGEEWVTIFYQATPITSMVPDNTHMVVPFDGLYLSPRQDGGQDALLINPDGTYAVDAGYSGEYGTTGRFDFTDTGLTITDDQRDDVPHCRANQASADYTFIFTGATLVLASDDDICGGRLNYFTNRVWTK